jgi:hypothetical protein
LKEDTGVSPDPSRIRLARRPKPLDPNYPGLLSASDWLSNHLLFVILTEVQNSVDSLILQILEIREELGHERAEE